MTTEGFMTIKKRLSTGATLTALAVALSIAVGYPPPKQDPDPGLRVGVVLLAAHVPSQDPGGGSPGVTGAASNSPGPGSGSPGTTVAAADSHIGGVAAPGYLKPGD